MNGETCLKKRIVIKEDNYYLTVGKTFASLTIPHENRPDNLEKRLLFDLILGEVSNLMVELSEK